MSEKDNKKSLFSGDKLPDYENTGDTVSQGKNFNNTNYVKKWEMYWNTLSTDINYSNNWKLGDTVEIVETHEKYSGKKGKLTLGFTKEPDMLYVKFKDGKKDFVEKALIRKISIYDYLNDKEIGQ